MARDETRNERLPMAGLFAAEPTRDATLRLRGLVLDLLVKLVDLLHRGGFGIVFVRLGFGFGLRKLSFRPA